MSLEFTKTKIDEAYEVYPSKVENMYPIIVNLDDSIKKIYGIKGIDFRPATIVAKKGEEILNASISSKLIILALESESRVGLVVLHRKQLRHDADRIFKEIFKLFNRDEPITVHCMGNKYMNTCIHKLFIHGNVTSFITSDVTSGYVMVF